MITSENFKEYKLLDAGDKEKLESWNGIILRRPDPMAIWPKTREELWEKADAFLLETEDIEVGTWEASGSYSPTIEVHHNDGWYSDFKKFDLVFDLQLATQYYKSLKKK